MGLLLSPDHTATLTDPLTWKDNPFVTRDLRRDIKKRQPFISFCWMSGVLILAAWATSLLWSVQAAMHGTPLFIGGDLGTGLCVIISGVHIWFIVGAARKHTTRLFTEESNQNTLSSLLMLPVSPFQILVQTMAYPWAAAMRMAVALLPVYVLCVGIDGPNWLELAMLYLVFAMAALSVPYWKRPALSENIAILAPPKRGVFGGASRQGSVGQDTASRSAGTSGALAFRLFLIPVMLSWIFIWRLGGMSAAQETLHQYLPNSIISLLDSVIISWPLLCARLLITPLDWFGIGIIPLPFALVFFLLSRYVQLVRASEFLSVGAYRDLPIQSTYLPRLRLVAGLRIAQALVVTGYLWKLAVVNGALGFLSPPVGGANPPGLGGFAILVLLFAATWGIIRGVSLGQWHQRPLIRGERYILCRNSLVDVARYLLEPFLFAAAFYLTCCLLGRTVPFPPLVNATAGNLGSLFLQAWLIGLSGAVFSFGVSRFFGPLGYAFRFAIPAMIGIAVYYSESTEIQAWLTSFPRIAHSLAFIPHLRRLEIFSPFLGIVHSTATRTGSVSRLLPGSPTWPAWVATSLALGGALWLLAHLLGRRANAAESAAVTLVFNPTVLGREVFSDPVHLKREGVGRIDTPAAQALIARLQRIWDNAIVTRELRARLRGHWEANVLWTALCMAAAFSFVFFHPMLATWPVILGGWVAYALMGSMSSAITNTAAGILGCWYIVLFVMTLCSAFSTSGAFYSETQKSTLGFLLSTPMSTRSIVLGKALGILGPSICVLGSISAWTLLLTILFMPLVGPLALLGWFYAVLSALTFYLMVNSITFTISAMFPKLSMSGSAWVWMLLFWFGSGPLLWVYGMISLALVAAGLQGTSLWFAFIALGWVLIVLAYVISTSCIHSMRRRDLVFATSKRGN